MMGMLWVILFVALTGTQSAYGLPVRPTPQTLIHDPNAPLLGWGGESGLYAALPALVLVITAVGVLFGCTWCYRHKDCKLFTASATHLHEPRRTQPPDSGFSEPVNNNINEDNNNGPISLREMQNIANNNAAAYIVSENEERNRISRESVVEFEPLPSGIRVVDPLEHCADWFRGEDFPRNQLQYLREIGRGWFGRVVEGELEDAGNSSTVAVKILNQNASLEDKARFLNESKVYRDIRHENILAYVAKCLQEDPWMLIFEFCPTDLQQYLTVNRPKMAILNESGVPLRLMCDVTFALAHLHSRGYLYGTLWSGGVLVRGHAENARAVLGRYSVNEPQHGILPPETVRHPSVYTVNSEVWSLGGLIWEVCAWGATPLHHPPPMPDLPCPYRSHLYQVMQLCWNQSPEARPSAAQVHALINHLHSTHTQPTETKTDTISGTSDFEERWQRLKPNTIPKVDEHVAIVHAPSTSTQHFSSSDQEFDHSQTIQDSLSVDLDTAVSRSSSIMSDKEPLSVQIKSESLTNLHGSLEDVRNIYLTHNEMAVLECHQGNISLEDSREKEQDKSDSSVDPWLKDIIAGSQDDVSYYKDVSDVIKNLDNILNSEKTSSSESSHQASPSRDNLSLDCKKDYPMQSSMVKSPGITNFQNILETGFNTDDNSEVAEEDDGDRDTVGTLSHSFERHSDTTSQQTLENLTPETPIKDLDIFRTEFKASTDNRVDELKYTELPKVSILCSDIKIPKLKELCIASMPSVSGNLNISEDCQTSCDNLKRTDKETKSIDVIENSNLPHVDVSEDDFVKQVELNILKHVVLPDNGSKVEETNESTIENIPQTNLFNDLIQPTILQESVYESDEKKIFDDRSFQICEEQDDVPKTMEHETVNHSVVSNDIETETYCPTETVNAASNLDKQLNDNDKVHKHIDQEFETPIEESIEKPRITLLTREDAVDESLEDKTVHLPNIISVCDQINTGNSSDILLKEKKSDLIIDLPISHKCNKSRDIIESFTFIELERNNFTDIPTSIKSNDMPTLNSFVEIKSENTPVTELLQCLEGNADKKEITVINSSLSENVIEEVTPEKSREVVEKIVISENVDLDQNFHCDASTASTVANFPVLETLFDIKKEVEEDNEIPSEASTLSQKFPNPSYCSNDETILICDIENSVYFEQLGNNTENNSINILNEGQDNASEGKTLKFEEKDTIRVNAGKQIEIKLASDESSLEKAIQHLDQLTSHGLEHSLINNKANNITLAQENVTETVQNNDDVVEMHEAITNVEEKLTLSPDIVQNIPLDIDEKLETHSSENIEKYCEPIRSDIIYDQFYTQSNDSTIYNDLINNTNSELLKNSYVSNKQIKEPEKADSCLQDTMFSSSVDKLESTEYMDLPSVRETYNELNMEQLDTSKNNVVSSTPITSDASTENIDKNLDNSTLAAETLVMFENKTPDYGDGVTVKKLEQRFVPDSMSPFESPTRSHHTDTYDENSSVVLGPFENCTIELFKGVKSHELTDLPKEELLAFSSNFSEMNLETPSPLRDGNFLNEVPDISHDDVQFDDITSISETKPASTQDVVGTSGTQSSENTEESQSGTQKHISPSTPPNSPGIFLASTSQQKYLVDIDLNVNDSIPEPSSSLQQEIELNQIELQITSKLAMAENENNLNIEYSGPLTVQGFVVEESSGGEPERFLAGNCSLDIRACQLDEECVKALRNELELKLPLAQVAAIEPQCGSEWGGDLPPPPELVVSYPGALSPIAEETGQQLSAYDNDINWNPSIRTDSSESYPEPCNNSADEVTELPTGAQTHTHSTYTIHSKDHTPNATYTIQKDLGSSKEQTMTTDSLNASPYKKITPDSESANNDKAFNKDDIDKESNCERISQVSPFLVSPTTDTSAPDTSDNFDNATGVSTLSKTTLPTDAKLSKPTECLSKATSIDSWCSNDTLYNVEENFDDMAVDPETPLEFENEKPEKDEGNSESTDTLTHNENEKELSHCSTYIIHDSKSEPLETFSRDSMTANGNTYTKAKTEVIGVTPSTVKSESGNSPTKDLAYGTLMSGVPSYSNCTTEAASAFDDLWKLPQPELVRRSPLLEKESITTPPKQVEFKEMVQTKEDGPLTLEPRLKKIDSIDITFSFNNMSQLSKSDSSENEDWGKHEFKSPLGDSMAMMTLTSTPLTEMNDFENVEPIPMQLPQTDAVEISNFERFSRSLVIKPQDLSINSNQKKADSPEIILDGDRSILNKNINTESATMILERTPTYSDFENSAVTKPQENSLANISNQHTGSKSSDGFRYFENSARERVQDLSSLIDASRLLLKNERIFSEQTTSSVLASISSIHENSSACTENKQLQNDEPMQFLDLKSETNVLTDLSPLIDGSKILENKNVPSEQSLEVGNSSSNLDVACESNKLINENKLTSEESIPPLPTNPPSTTNLIESHNLVNFRDSNNPYLLNFDDVDEEMDQPHSIIITETSFENFRDAPSGSYDSHPERLNLDLNCTFDSHSTHRNVNGEIGIDTALVPVTSNTESVDIKISKDESSEVVNSEAVKSTSTDLKELPNSSLKEDKTADVSQCNDSQKYAVVNFLSETFEELLESNVDDGDVKDLKLDELDDEVLGDKQPQEFEELMETPIENPPKSIREEIDEREGVRNGSVGESGRITSVTKDFLQNEKKFCTLDSYFPLLSDIRFTGPATEIMSTSFSQESPTAPTSPECEQDNKPNAASDILKEWDSDSDTHSTNSSSGEFIWKQRGSGGSTSNSGAGAEMNSAGSEAGAASEASGSMGSASGSEGDEVEFVPSSWDCRAAPAKSSLRSLEQATPDSKKRVVFKRQKYHCVYEYPREVSDIEMHSPAAYLPDRSTYSEWDPSSAEEAELGYGQLFGSPSPLDMYPLRAGIALGPDYDEDFFISSSARPFESLGIMSTTSQFFPGMHMKRALMERDLSDDITEDFPPPPSPLTTTTPPSLDFTTPDSGVEDITPGSTTDEDFKKLPESELTWRPVDSASSSESVSPSSPGGEALGGLRHTRDKLKLDLPPSPHIPSPRHNRVFNFVLDKPKRRTQVEGGSTPLVMTDDTPVVTSSLPLQKDCEDLPIPEPTFSTFGKSVQKIEPELKIILTDEMEDGEVKEESPKVVEPVKGEGTVLDSGDEDSGIESSSKATLERDKTSNVS